MLNKSLQEFMDLGDEKGVAWCNVVLGDLSLRNDNQTEALAYYYKAISIYENNNLNHGKAEMNLKISKCYIDLKDYNNAIKYTQESISLAQELNSNYLLQEAYLIMSICYEKLDKYEKAHDFFKKYSYLKDSLLDREREKNIAEPQTKYESEKKDRQNRILSQQMDMKEIEKRQLENEIGKDKIIKTILIVGGLLLLAISF